MPPHSHAHQSCKGTAATRDRVLLGSTIDWERPAEHRSRAFQVGDAGGDALLDRHHPNLGAPFDVLWTVRSDEPGQSMNRAEALVHCGGGALPLALQMSEEV